MRLAAILLAAGCSGSDRRDGGGTDAGVDSGSDAGTFDAGGPFRREPDLEAMVFVGASKFEMGHPVEPPGAYGQSWKENELPSHDVTLPGYYLDRDEVTVGAYAEFLAESGGDVHFHPLQPIRGGNGRYEPAEGMADRPIAFVSWYDAATFCAWAGERLPSEAEWERAAHGSEGRLFPWGEDWPGCGHAVFYTGAVPCEEAPQAVGSRSPAGDSAEGLRDLAGNVAEWVGDVYDRYSDGAQDDPRGPAAGRYRVVRGGGFREAPSSLRATARFAADPADRSAGVGFRCAWRP